LSELRVDPIRCDAHGLCAELFPEGIVLDDWGYPILASGPVPRSLLRHAERAVAECPKRALALETVSREAPAGRGGGGPQ
jgi:ferredoxin